MKRIILKFDPPLDWKEAKKLDLGIPPLSVIYWSRSAAKIEGIECFEKDVEKISLTLRKKKVAFKLDK